MIYATQQRSGVLDRRVAGEDSVAAEAGEPLDRWVFAEPGELAFGVVAMALLGEGDRFVAGDFAAQHGDGLGVAERGERAAFEAVGSTSWVVSSTRPQSNISAARRLMRA